MTSKVSLARIYYPVKVLGPGLRVGIWLNGCRKCCPGCISPEMREYDPSKEFTVNGVIRMISEIPGRIDGFTVSGGEPFYDPEALCCLVAELARINDDILIFTGYTLEELKGKKDRSVDSVLNNCAALVDGPFISELNDGVGLRGASNQHLRVFKYRDRYAGMENSERCLQHVMFDKGLLTIGIP